MLTPPRLARPPKFGSSCSVGLQFMPASIAGLRLRSTEPMQLAEPMSRMAEPTADDMAEAGVKPSCRTRQQQHTARQPCQTLAEAGLCFCHVAAG
jgi:hypothetical protein